MAVYPKPLEVLIRELAKMPGIGPKSAQRLAFYILNLSEERIKSLAFSISSVKEKVTFCSTCFNLADSDPCAICEDETRDRSLLCVVAEVKDMIAIEKSKDFKGRYHVLGGVIAPLDGVGPENLKVRELLERVSQGEIKEIILAMNPTVEGETTSMYLTKILKPLGVKITRIAYGLPVGADIDFADQVTISMAFEGRREVS